MKGIKDTKTGKFTKNLPDKACLYCKKIFHPRFSTIKFCSKKCEGLARTKNHNRNCIQCGDSFSARSMKTRFCSHECYGNSGVGARKKELNNNWKGGITPLSKKIRNSKKYLAWVKSVKERDEWVCVWCGGTKDLEVDHIIPFARIIEKIRFEMGSENIFENSMKCFLLWDKSNGRTLCLECHRKTDTYLNQKIKTLCH